MTIYLLVKKNGVSSKMSRQFGYQELLISSDVCIEQNVLQYKHFVLEKRYTHKEINNAKNSINDLDILKCDISNIEVDEIYSGYNIYRAKINRFLKIDNFKELTLIKDSLLKTRSLKNNLFNDASYKIIDGCIDTNCIINNQNINVYIDFNIDKEINKIKETIKQLVDFSSNLLLNIDLSSVKKFTATELLDTAIDWLNDGETIDIESFVKRITFDSFSIYNDFEYTLTFDDGDIFSGHGVHAQGNINQGFIEAYIQ